MSEEVQAAIHDLAYWRRRAETAEADAAALRAAARQHTQGPLAERPRGWDMLVRLLDSEHPGDALLERLERLEAALSTAEHALLIYAYGNSAPDLARSVAQQIKAVRETKGATSA